MKSLPIYKTKQPNNKHLMDSMEKPPHTYIVCKKNVLEQNVLPWLIYVTFLSFKIIFTWPLCSTYGKPLFNVDGVGFPYIIWSSVVKLIKGFLSSTLYENYIGKLQ